MTATFSFAQRAGLLFLLIAFGVAAADDSPSLVRDGDRVVFVGDSITGQGMNVGAGGFVNLFKAGLDAARSESSVTVVALGGSGQTVGSWRSIEKQSREKEVFLDVKAVDVRNALDRHADILIVMLGMNDTLSPSMDARPASLDAWAGRYRELLAALRGRTTPRVTALATITPNTEDPTSPKNLAIAEMNRRVGGIAAEQDCILLPTSETIWETLRAGRRCKPDFHITSDFVHPNGTGHASIAAGMLRGLGETRAAEAISTQHIQKALDAARGERPCLSYAIVPRELPLGSDEATFEIRAFWTPDAASGTPRFSLEAPKGWQVQPAETQGNETVFVVTGKPERLENVFTLSAAADSRPGDHKQGDRKKEATISIPAPWLVGTGFTDPAAWERGAQDYVPDKGVLPGEDRFAAGKDFGGTPAQFSCDILCENPDDAASLRISTVPRP